VAQKAWKERGKPHLGKSHENEKYVKNERKWQKASCVLYRNKQYKWKEKQEMKERNKTQEMWKYNEIERKWKHSNKYKYKLRKLMRKPQSMSKRLIVNIVK